MRGRPADGEYARFVEATVRLADEAVDMPRRARFSLTVALFGVWESERNARTALATQSGPRLAQAASAVRTARATLATAADDTAAELRRRRLISLV
jgi:hypothetical protein